MNENQEMTDTLREEIQNIIYMRMGGKIRVSLPWTQSGEAAKDILKAFEKRIESVKEHKDEHNYSGDNEFIDGFDLGFNHAIEKMKELLK